MNCPCELVYEMPRGPETKERTTTPNELGKRYRCTICNSEFLVTKGGNGELSCDGKPLVLMGPAGSTSTKAPGSSPETPRD